MGLIYTVEWDEIDREDDNDYMVQDYADFESLDDALVFFKEKCSKVVSSVSLIATEYTDEDFGEF